MRSESVILVSDSSSELVVIMSPHGRSYHTCRWWQIRDWEEMSRSHFGILHIPKIYTGFNVCESKYVRSISEKL